MIPKGADKVGGAKALPIRLVMLATLLALALIASMGWYVWNSVRVLHAVQDRTFRLLALTGQVSYLSESRLPSMIDILFFSFFGPRMNTNEHE